MIDEIFKQFRQGANIRESSDLVTDYSLDSFDIANLVAEIEEKYSITIAMEDIDMENFRTIETIEKMIERNR